MHNTTNTAATLSTFRVTTDSASETIDAANADEAARIFAESEGFTGVTDLDSLRAYLVRAGGYGTVADADGAIVMRVGA